MKIDLHIHSSASDGSFGPAEIIHFVTEQNLSAFSITDHDTVDGNREILQITLPDSVHFISGVEISSFPPEPFISSGSFHILGYGFDIDNTDLNQALRRFQDARTERNPRIIKKLNNLGIDICMDEVSKESGGGVIGRPHIASLMLRKGYVDSIKDAFDQFLAKGKPAFVDKYRIDSENSIKLIRNAGGIPVLAHPVSLEMTFEDTGRLLKKLKGFGLMGIEAYYTNHSHEMTNRYCAMASELDLLVTGGSDFHGTFKDDVSIGTGKGDLCVPQALYNELEKALNQKRDRV